MLQLIQQATAEMGLSVPTAVAGSLIQDVIQLQALLNATGYQIYREWQWQAMTNINMFTTPYLTTTGTVVNGLYTITGIPDTSTLSTNYQVVGVGINNATYVSSVDSATQVTMSQPANASGAAETITFSQVKFSMPSDYDRQIDRTHWDKTQHWEMLGPETAQQWEWLTSGYISTGPRVRYRIFGSKFQIWPAQGTLHTLGFEYCTNTWALSTLGVAKTSMTVDTDTCIFPDRLMVLGIKKLYFQVKGFNPIFDAEYNMQLDIAKSNDAGSQTLSMNPRINSILIGQENIPDSGYGM